MYIILLSFLNIMLSYVLYNYFFVEKIILRIYMYEIETTSHRTFGSRRGRADINLT